MRHLPFYLMMISASVTYSSEPSDVLKHFESCYQAINPAIENSAQTFVWLSNVQDPFLNVVTRLSCDDVAAKVDAIIEKVPTDVPFSFWVHSQNSAANLSEILKERGFHPILKTPLMTWEVKQVFTKECDIRKADMETFLHITGVTFQMSESVLEQYGNLLNKIKSENYLYYADGKAVGTGLLFQNGEVGGVYNIASLPEYQKKGYAKAMMQHLMDRAFKLGIKQLILQSLPETEKLYRDLEFDKALEIDVYVREVQ